MVRPMVGNMILIIGSGKGKKKSDNVTDKDANTVISKAPLTTTAQRAYREFG